MRRLSGLRHQDCGWGLERRAQGKVLKTGVAKEGHTGIGETRKPPTPTLGGDGLGVKREPRHFVAMPERGAKPAIFRPWEVCQCASVER